jgi:hypothetical protein
MNIHNFYIELGCLLVTPVNCTIQRAIVLKGFYLWVVPWVLQSEGESAERAELFK